MSELIFKPATTLTFDTASEDSRKLRKLMNDNASTHICLDLHEVSQCDSAGLALLIEATRLCKQHHKTLNIQGMSKSILALAEFCAVKDILPNQ